MHFAYGLTPTLKDVSLTIPAGTSAAFVGPTGAGKTTLVNMLPRFYDPAAGAVKIDGRDIREYALPALRSSLALVSQETALVNGTVRDNIGMGKLEATDDEVVAAAKAACIHTFIMSLPAGYDTIVGERGNRFSAPLRELRQSVRPPSTMTVWPVIIEPPAHRKKTTSAMSSGLQARFSGVFSTD